MKTGSLGILLLGIYLVLSGLAQLINLHFSGLPVLLGVLAVAAGGALLLRR
ncbi:MAG: hypothetical protein ACT4TC_09015 [Myxococcaceae bacterium]